MLRGMTAAPPAPGAAPGAVPVLAGQVIAVTGADQGYGRTISAALARAGASVVLVGDNSVTLAAAASVLEGAGGTAVPIQADVSVPLDWLSALPAKLPGCAGATTSVVAIVIERAVDSLLDESTATTANVYETPEVRPVMVVLADVGDAIGVPEAVGAVR